MTGEAQKGSILILDDDKFLAEMYGMKFSANGYDVQTCLSTNEAIGVLKGGFTPDCIIFDVLMPERDGFAFLQALANEKLAERAALIALTNQGNDTEKVKAQGLGVDRYIVKASMIPSEVVQAVEEEVAKKRKT